ncbi:hypothetical protein FYK55_10290 [Roseiconus nitratireducens]|uniref:Uncharacterized protein n=1 Tax=Roseiconus nitratireducens TaxID=2605748 RepID=A0A5M6D8C1_9BACT|nr:hypothetical protein [Roseiconus nitratireducens]KAA5543593.1 hypothetical protein FYK55_10290 [Roseiconus nitratireducens]
MRHQLFQVWRSYLRRPLVLLIGVIAACLSLGLLLQTVQPAGGARWIAPQIDPPGGWTWIDVSDWGTASTSRQPADLTGLRLSDHGYHPFPDLRPLVNLTALELNSRDLTSQKLASLRSLPELQALSLQAPELPDGALTTIGGRLVSLQIPARLLESEGDELSTCTRLQTLIVDRYGMTPKRLSCIANFPQLKTLVITTRVHDQFAGQQISGQGNVAGSTQILKLTPDSLKALANHPSLETIYADWEPGVDRRSTTLPGVRLYPASISRSALNAISLGLFFTAAVSVLVTLQWWVHFVGQRSMLIPDYQQAHRWAGLIPLLLAALLTGGVLRFVDVALLPAMMFALVFASLIPACMIASQSPFRTTRIAFTLLGLCGAALLWFPIAIPVSLPPAAAGESAWFLRGAFGWVAGGVLLSELLMLGWACRALPTLAREVREKSPLLPGLSPWDPQQQRRAVFSSPPRRSWLGNPSSPFQFPKGDGLLDRAKLWRIGNAYRPLAVTLFVGIFLLVFVGIQGMLGGGQSLFRRSAWFGVAVQLSAIGLILPLNVWYRRCRTFQVESLRPVQRSRMIRQLFAALAVDQSIAMIPMLILAALLLWFPDPTTQQKQSAWLIGFGPVAVAWCYAFSTAVFAIRRGWVLIAYATVMMLLPSVWLGALGWFADHASWSEPVQLRVVWLHVMVAIVLAAILVWTTYRRALQREWGYSTN